MLKKSITDSRSVSINRKSVLSWTLVIVFHFASAAIATWPLAGSLSTWGGGPDVFMYSWTFGWDWHALTTNPLGLFNANIFHPTTGSLATSDHMLGILVFWVVPWVMTHKQFFSDGMALYLVYAFGGVALHIWLHYWTKDHLSAGLGATWVNLNPLRIYNAGAIHSLGTLWMPLLLLAMDRWLVKGGKRWWGLMVAAFWLQFQVSYYLAYGVLILSAVYFPLSLWLRPVKSPRRALAGALLGCVILFFTLIPFALPYMGSTGFIKDNMEMLILSSPRFPQDFLLAYPRSWLWSLELGMSGPVDASSFPLWVGLGIPVLGMTGLAACILKGRGATARDNALLMAIPSFFIFLLALGPYLKIGSTATGIPLPFLFFMKAAPGFDNMSTPSRFMYTFLIIWAPLVGLGLAHIFRSAGERFGGGFLQKTMVATMGILLILDVACKPMDESPIRFRAEPREVTSWLAQHEVKGGILEMPFTVEQYLNNTLYMIQSLRHFHPLANGYGSFFPPYFRAVTLRAEKLPDPDALRQLAILDIRTYVLHLDMTDFMRMADTDGPVSMALALKYYPKLAAAPGVDAETVKAFDSNPYLREIARFPKDIVYEYVLPVEVAEVLRGRVFKIEINRENQLLIYIEFAGSGGKAWRNPYHPRPVKMRTWLESKDGGGRKIGPFDSELFLPQLNEPGKRVIRHIRLHDLPNPGSYNVEIISEKKEIQIIPAMITVAAPGR